MKYFYLPLLLWPLATPAQMPQGMDQAQMQRMMEQMQKVQTCMRDVDQAAMQRLQQRAREMEKKVDMLCRQGQRDEAQNIGMAFGKEIADNPAMQQMKKCGEHMQGVMSGMPLSIRENLKNAENRHVCDH
ncbi:MAG: hypothetical protein ACU84J_02220 [Gammaproteobacteria bacterium]